MTDTVASQETAVPTTEGDKLLAGKFKTPEDLEKGYRELEKRLGTQPSAATLSASERVGQQGSEGGTEPSKARHALEAAIQSAVEAGVQEATATAEKARAEKALASEVGAELSRVAGGDEEAKLTLEWANVNLPTAEQAVFNSALESANPALIAIAFTHLREKYTEAVGTQGSRVSAEAVSVATGTMPYASKTELLKVVRSPEYKKGDPKVHAAHKARLAETDFGTDFYR